MCTETPYDGRPRACAEPGNPKQAKRGALVAKPGAPDESTRRQTVLPGRSFGPRRNHPVLKCTRPFLGKPGSHEGCAGDRSHLSTPTSLGMPGELLRKTDFSILAATS